MNKTEIPWTDFTWTVSRGCYPVSDGCANCYAAKMASRFAGPGGVYEGLAKGGKWTGKIQLCPENLDEPLKRKKPARIFVNSMSDLFHENITLGFIHRVYETMAFGRQHTYQLLTKRPSLMRKTIKWIETDDTSSIGRSIKNNRWPLLNVWAGVTVENQPAADERIPILLDIPAAVRFISIEPMLEPINIFRKLELADYVIDDSNGLPQIRSTPQIDWVIVGCESGPGARPCSMDWIRDIRDQCAAAGVPVFIKQARIYGELVKMPKIDGVVYDQFPEG